MEKKNKNLEFLSYIKTPLTEESIAVLYSANNIRYERCVLFDDFVQSLLSLVFDTYMGDDITDDSQRVNHFTWCWEKNIDNFNKEGISFANTDSAYNYFVEFMIEVFYGVNNKESKTNMSNTIKRLWKDMFSYSGAKSRSDMDNFIEIYGILEKSLKKGQKRAF